MYVWIFGRNASAFVAQPTNACVHVPLSWVRETALGLIFHALNPGAAAPGEEG